MSVAFPRISIDSAICGGKPVIAGTRMRVADLLAMLAEGAGEAAILLDFPYLAEDDIRAALAYAAWAADHPVVQAAE